MYTGLLHSHRLFVILFLLLYLTKLILLIANKQELLEKFNTKLRIPEMIISALFLLTGIGMMFMVAKITFFLILKIVLVAASIPIAIKGFRDLSKPLAAFSVMLIILAYGLAEMNKVGVETTPLAAEIITEADQAGYDQLAHGLAIYDRNCQVCHGADGRQAGSGAKDLTQSKLTEADMRNRILNGKNSMPAYEEVLSPTEVNAVLSYIKTLND